MVHALKTAAAIGLIWVFGTAAVYVYLPNHSAGRQGSSMAASRLQHHGSVDAGGGAAPGGHGAVSSFVDAGGGGATRPPQLQQPSDQRPRMLNIESRDADPTGTQKRCSPFHPRHLAHTNTPGSAAASYTCQKVSYGVNAGGFGNMDGMPDPAANAAAQAQGLQLLQNVSITGSVPGGVPVLPSLRRRAPRDTHRALRSGVADGGR